MLEWHRIIDELGKSEEPCLLATILHVDGSAYRKEGAVMLMKEDGSRTGMISGGCLESDLSARAGELIRDGGCRTLLYDMRAEDDLSWGSGAGCGGAVQVLLEPVHPALRKQLRTAKDCLDRGIAVTLVRKLHGDRTTDKIRFIPQGRRAAFGSRFAVPRLPDEYADPRKCGIYYAESLKAELFIQTLTPKRRLIIFGAGEDARPLAAMAAQAGFAVVVADWRPAYCDPAHFPDAASLLVGFPGEIATRLDLSGEDSAVVMTHNFERDKELVSYLLQHELRYLGILGPRHRTARLLRDYPGTPPEWLHSPAGLAIGAEGPEEIAVSIVADLIRMKRSEQKHGAQSPELATI